MATKSATLACSSPLVNDWKIHFTYLHVYATVWHIRTLCFDLFSTFFGIFTINLHYFLIDEDYIISFRFNCRQYLSLDTSLLLIYRPGLLTNFMQCWEIMKTKLNSDADGHQFHQYGITPSHLNSLNIKRPQHVTLEIQVMACERVKPVNGIWTH